MEKKLYLVETVSMFRMRYVIEAVKKNMQPMNLLWKLAEDFHEFSQQHIDEVIVSTRELSAKDYLELFDKDNQYLKSWDIAEKMRFINSVDYKE
jgi:hypothetical protein